MNAAAHDRRMTEVYAHIYEDFYAFEERAMAAASAIIQKNLEEIGISPEQLKTLQVLNVGTGREAMAFHRLGAKAVFHFDISGKSVSILSKLRRADPAFRNIHTRRLDVCDPSGLRLEAGIDFVYLNGVLHHLHDPAAAVRNIAAVLNPSAKCFFRIYRSGCLGFYVTDFIRRFIRYQDRREVMRQFALLYPQPSEASRLLYVDLYDNFFVPVLQLYDPVQVDAYFERLGFRACVAQRHAAYDHADTRPSGQGVSLYYERRGSARAGRRPAPFPPHIDQLQGIAYRESHIQATNALMSEFLARAGRLSQQARVKTAVALYERSQLYRINHRVTSEQKHEELQEALATALGSSQGRLEPVSP